MRSRAVRLISGTVAWLSIAAAAFLVFQTETQIRHEVSSLRTFEQRARESEALLSDLRTAQQAYVAEGQGVTFWMPKVSALSESASGAVASLRDMPVSPAARASLSEAVSTLAAFGDVDKRAREYLQAGEPLMAGDVIYTEGSEAAASAARHVESARVAEQQALDSIEAQLRNQEMMIASGAAGVAALAVLLLVPRPRQKADTDSLSIAPRTVAPPTPPIAAPARATPAPQLRPSPVLKAAADLATDFGRVLDLDDLSRLLGRLADIMDASGIIVWMGSAGGADLRASLAHGYSAQAVARMPGVPRSGNNAAASAYRTGALQIVLSRPGGPAGAIVAPILAANGCIGALSAEIRGGGETSEGVQTLATMFAAHLAGILQAAPDEQPQSAAAANS